ncbi:hypothetical protein [Marinobacterium sp. xm-d-530]|uniref:hypothetical protein n=1 Tax=Marinobacterium sp. xm-d-530 TaxID=2497747 RepID=UPI00156918F8|nr:hypothetical protein [Marinobacterium sp. xm-d-530]NRQ01301.1 hypothetical protein [Marinobacterium sp. xm-d-530]
MTSMIELKQKLGDLDSNEHYEILVNKKKNEKTPPFLVIGNGKASKEFPEDVAIDAIGVLSKLSPKQMGIVIDLKDILVNQNIWNFYRKRRVHNPNLIVLDKNKENELHKSIRTRMSDNKNGAKLQELEVLQQIKPGTYMLNPYMFIPPYEFKRVAQIWKDMKTTS